MFDVLSLRETRCHADNVRLYADDWQLPQHIHAVSCIRYLYWQ